MSRRMLVVLGILAVVLLVVGLTSTWRYVVYVVRYPFLPHLQVIVEDTTWEMGDWGKSQKCTDEASTSPCIKVKVSEENGKLRIEWDTDNPMPGSTIDLTLIHAPGGSVVAIADKLNTSGNILWAVPKTRLVCSSPALDVCGPRVPAPIKFGDYRVAVSLLPHNYYPTSFAEPNCPEGTYCGYIHHTRSHSFRVFTMP